MPAHDTALKALRSAAAKRGLRVRARSQRGLYVVALLSPMASLPVAHATAEEPSEAIDQVRRRLRPGKPGAPMGNENAARRRRAEARARLEAEVRAAWGVAA